jgi:hypothetical protein
MRTSRGLIGITSILAATLLTAAPVGAATIFVAPDGANTANCGTAANPCLTLQVAHNRADSGGTILLTQPGNYGPATFTKPVNVRGVPGAGIFSPTLPCLTINAAGGNDTITLTDVSCDQDGGARDGIVINDAHKLRLNNVSIRGNTGTTCGVRARPTSGVFELMINDSSLTESGTTGNNNGGGICILPTGTANVFSVIRNTQLQNNRHGLVSAPVGGAISNVLVDNAAISANVGGIFSVGSNSNICVRNSTIAGNTFMGLSGSGDVLNGGGNLFFNNSADGPFTGSCAPPP